jgi:hypothetical protein
MAEQLAIWRYLVAVIAMAAFAMLIVPGRPRHVSPRSLDDLSVTVRATEVIPSYVPGPAAAYCDCDYHGAGGGR